MAIDLDLQKATSFEPLPDEKQFALWVRTALQESGESELTIRLVDREESRRLNSRYCGKDAATNVLSFPAELPEDVDVPLLGDIVICAPLVAEEADAQGKSLQAHWAHLTLHGILHLLGYDHQQEAETQAMEALEVELLDALGYRNPYG